MSCLKIKIFTLFFLAFYMQSIFASKTGLLFRHKILNILEWKSYGDSKINPKYEGNVVNFKPDGFGKLIYPNGNNFEGYWKDGKIHGQGTFIWPDGRKYVGFFKNGEPIGKGTYIYKDGSKESGKWEYSKQKFFWETKSSSSVDFVKKKGVLSYRKENARWGWYDYGEVEKDGIYIGEIKNMKPNGYGKFTYGKGRWQGDKYEGMWKDGKFHGEGTLTRKNGEKYIGKWKNSNLWNISKFSKFGRLLKNYIKGIEVPIKTRNGSQKKNIINTKKEKGILFIHIPRSRWVGIDKEWSKSGDEKKHGKYEGEIVNGLPNGKGEYSWFNVNKYIGEFKNGMFHGKGTFYSLPSKVKIVGEFRNDKEWNATQIDGEGNIVGKYVNGEKIK